jgi:protein ImuA
MMSAKAEILSRLQREILPLQGFKPALHNAVLDRSLEPLVKAFPGSTFPLGALHEFVCDSEEAAAATTGFISSITGWLMRDAGAVLWIQNRRQTYPPSLLSFGLSPERIIFLDLQKDKDILWATEEALKCAGLAAVIAEISNFSFTDSRRLQLAVEHSKATGFILRYKARQLPVTASIARWKITPLPSTAPDDLPGVGFPYWQVELLKVRNGRTGSWPLEWRGGALRSVEKERWQEPQKKTA